MIMVSAAYTEIIHDQTDVNICRDRIFQTKKLLFFTAQTDILILSILM